MSARDSREPLLMIEQARRVVHRADCPLLLTLHAQLEPYVGLEHAMEECLQLCACVLVKVVRSSAEFIGQTAISTESPAVQTLSENLFRVVKAFDEQLQEVARSTRSDETPN